MFYSPLNQKVVYTKSSVVSSLKTQAFLTELEKYTKYQIDVCGYTTKGEGPKATTIVMTGEDGMNYYSNQIKCC